ncbi:hypothetical protein EGH67_17970 [Klebsiella aerogenes]|uniref:Uncharacterized protein n=1 Tax=Klebsiella aerogenes (strain ATCC 13048 / DSM 30053 / CCUG 1429 / JCM 1235 / KCTC 2190 / NBRC 13534 / NCIMB 10102 / NCTC 10006 / CDC 819-56) TaxID=1028307 RepID=A0A0H3FWN2_KLEAK|nr:hypothetical protein EAE_11535 [Klebsiella aerogenes KCTC 2190]ATM89918.1 hypothetical protein CRN78_04955 [Klebsiella aerogenes]ATX86378.1 hypothetical protein AM345_05590 [Klebsiella aerogenes]AVE39669.1 hypothetical protein C4J64_15935 [Klebsiella aerogenes]MBF8481233.1 hypothetical protein [Klebsiella aerogenes]
MLWAWFRKSLAAVTRRNIYVIKKHHILPFIAFYGCKMLVKNGAD